MANLAFPDADNERLYDLMGKHLQLVDIGVESAKGVRPAPAGFDARKADAATLLAHGLIPRPDPALMPKAAAIWDRLAGQSYEHVLPRLKSRPERKDKLVDRALLGPRGEADDYSGNWSGGLIFNPSTTDPIKSVYGEWTVPSVVPPTSADGDWWSVAWIGVDGYGSSDVMQVGTGQHVKRSGGKVTTEYFAWVEWYTYNWQTVSLTVNPGDTISANITNTGLQNGVLQATGRITNMTTGQTTAVAVSAPPGTIFKGNVAEWIMERPGINNQLATLPRFGTVDFGGVLCCTAASKSFNAGQGVAVDMTSDGTQNGKRYASGAPSSDWSSSWVASS